MAQDLPVSVTQAQHPGAIGYRGGFVRLLDDMSRPEGLGGVIRESGLGGKDLSPFSASLDCFDKTGCETPAADGRDDEIEIESERE
jgi:hypothetical protein